MSLSSKSRDEMVNMFYGRMPEELGDSKQPAPELRDQDEAIPERH